MFLLMDKTLQKMCLATRNLGIVLNPKMPHEFSVPNHPSLETILSNKHVGSQCYSSTEGRENSALPNTNADPADIEN